MYSPTFCIIESWRRSIIFSILCRRSSRFASFVSNVVLRSIIFSNLSRMRESFSETTCSAISVIVSELIEGEEYC